MRAITIHEHANDSGVLVQTRLVYDEGRLAIDVSDDSLPLPEGSLDAVMKRYGKPLAFDPSNADFTPAEELDLDSGKRLIRFRFRSRFDVVARDYLALLTPDQEPLCELATAVTAALQHIAKSFSRVAQ